LVWTPASGETDYLNRRWFEYTGVSEKEQVRVGWLDALTRMTATNHVYWRRPSSR